MRANSSYPPASRQSRAVEGSPKQNCRPRPTASNGAARTTRAASPIHLSNRSAESFQFDGQTPIHSPLCVLSVRRPFKMAPRIARSLYRRGGFECRVGVAEVGPESRSECDQQEKQKGL